MEMVIRDWDDFVKWLNRKAKHTEEIEQENVELAKENMQLRSELEQIKNATAGNSDESIFNTDSIPRIFKGRDSNVK